METHTSDVGPLTSSLVAMREAYVPRGVSTTTPVQIVEARGAVVRSADGRTYLDFAGGLGALNVGHGHPKVLAAVHRQVNAYLHACIHTMSYELYVALAGRLAERVPGPFRKKTLLVNSGAEAVENAVKLARAFTGRPGVIAFQGAFHGRTLLGLSLTGKYHPYKTGFAPFVPDVYHVPFPSTYRPPTGVSADQVLAHVLDAIERLLTSGAANSVAAVIVEPVQGEGGFVVPPSGFLRALRRLCTDRGLLLIVDEVQTAFGRTGRMFAVEHENVAPDLIVLGKSLASGLPLAAVVGRAEIMDTPPPGGLGGTYGGNPVACAAALAVLQVFDEEDLVGRAQRIGTLIAEGLRAMQEQVPLIGDVRGMGAMMAMELVTDRAAKTPARAETAALIEGCWKRGLVIMKAGVHDNVVRVLVPLVVTDDQLEEGLAIIKRALEEVVASREGA